MLTNEYLYGDNEIPEVPEYIIMRRVEILEERLEEVLAVHYTRRDLKLERELLKAISFWRNINNG
jgi:hypothetical protein